MGAKDAMTVDERRKYLRLMQRRYEGADREERGRLLDEMQEVTDMHRKSLLRLLGSDLERRPRRTQRRASYQGPVRRAVAVIAESIDYPCAERLTPNLVWLAKQLAAHGELAVDEELLEQLGKVSVSTVRRMLGHWAQEHKRLPAKGPERANQALRDVPMRRLRWDEAEPGHMEADLVHHCGRSSEGEYLHTLQLLDVATGWSECVAVMGRSYLAMKDGFQRILARLPFPLVELHPDNGSEFFNQHLRRFYQESLSEVELSRSRPFHKNDNPRVEQKNSSLVRAYLGYGRLDSPAQAVAVSKLYDYMWLYYNFFQPVMHIADKRIIQVPGERSRVKRCYDTATTPFDRLCATGVLSVQKQEELTALRAETNPVWLRERIYDSIEQIRGLPCVQGIYNVRHIMAAVAEDALVPVRPTATSTKSVNG